VDIVYPLLRLLHIVAAVFWFSSAMMMVVYVEPAVRSAGESGSAVMQGIIQRGLPIAGNVSAIIAVVAGMLLYGRDFGSSGNPFASGNPTVLAFALGALAAILVLIVTFVIAAPTGRGLAKFGSAIRAQAQRPTPEQLRRLSGLQSRALIASRVNLGLLTAALALMAVARGL
jgi:uncharacterized membrane protein